MPFIICPRCQHATDFAEPVGDFSIKHLLCEKCAEEFSVEVYEKAKTSGVTMGYRELNEITVYECDVAGLSRDQAEETGITLMFAAASPDHAILSAAQFLRNRCNALGLIPACIKVNSYYIGTVGHDGAARSGRNFPFFEWKHDTSPSSFEDILYSERARQAHRR